MLGVVTNPTMTKSDVEMTSADAVRPGDTFHPTPVGSSSDATGRKEPGVEVPDPFFGGAAVRRGFSSAARDDGLRHNPEHLSSLSGVAERAARKSSETVTPCGMPAATTVARCVPGRGVGAPIRLSPPRTRIAGRDVRHPTLCMPQATTCRAFDGWASSPTNSSAARRDQQRKHAD